MSFPRRREFSARFFALQIGSQARAWIPAFAGMTKWLATQHQNEIERAWRHSFAGTSGLSHGTEAAGTD